MDGDHGTILPKKSPPRGQALESRRRAYIIGPERVRRRTTRPRNPSAKGHANEESGSAMIDAGRMLAAAGNDAAMQSTNVRTFLMIAA
jgi:hypothetical protein